jgi:hypothetical protein
VVQSLTGNADFAAVNPTVAMLSAKLADYRTALTMPPGQARDQAVDASRSALTDTMEAMARNCETITKDKVKLATTGFDLRKDPARSDAPVDAPQNLRLKSTGNNGEIQLLCDPVDRARSYQVQYATDPNAGPWTDAGTFPSTRGIVLNGLQRGKDYWGRIRAVGPNGAGAWSDPATIMVT